ncbi:unnamed protein product, partial [Didymodactylos carnosus]
RKQMASLPTESLYHVAMIHWTINMGMEPASKALALFIRHGCQIQSTVSDTVTVVHTLVHSQGFSLSKEDESMLQELRASGHLSILIA